MMHTTDNPGKYDDACTQARLATGALGTVLLVLGGRKGHGFSVQAPPEVLSALPGMLETVAAEIRRDLQAMKS